MSRNSKSKKSKVSKTKDQRRAAGGSPPNPKNVKAKHERKLDSMTIDEFDKELTNALNASPTRSVELDTSSPQKQDMALYDATVDGDITVDDEASISEIHVPHVLEPIEEAEECIIRPSKSSMSNNLVSVILNRRTDFHVGHIYYTLGLPLLQTILEGMWKLPCEPSGSKKPYTLRPDAPSWVAHVLKYCEEMDAPGISKASNKKPTLLDGIYTDEDIENTYNRNMGEKSSSEPGDLQGRMADFEDNEDCDVDSDGCHGKFPTRSQSLPPRPTPKHLEHERCASPCPVNDTIDDCSSSSKKSKLSISTTETFCDSSDEITSPNSICKLDETVIMTEPPEVIVNMQFEQSSPETRAICQATEESCLTNTSVSTDHPQNVDQAQECNVSDDNLAAGNETCDSVDVQTECQQSISQSVCPSEAPPSNIGATAHPEIDENIQIGEAEEPATADPKIEENAQSEEAEEQATDHTDTPGMEKARSQEIGQVSSENDTTREEAGNITSPLNQANEDLPPDGFVEHTTNNESPNAGPATSPATPPISLKLPDPFSDFANISPAHSPPSAPSPESGIRSAISYFEALAKYHADLSSFNSLMVQLSTNFVDPVQRASILSGMESLVAATRSATLTSP